MPSAQWHSLKPKTTARTPIFDLSTSSGSEIFTLLFILFGGITMQRANSSKATIRVIFYDADNGQPVIYANETSQWHTLAVQPVMPMAFIT